MPEKIMSLPHEVEAELTAMKLDRVGLLDAVRYAEQERSFVTSNDAIGYGSYLVYDKAGRRLREIYLPQGWEKDDTNNQCAIRHQETKIRVVPCNFDRFAGDPETRPSNKSPKGEVSKKKSMCNRTAWLPGLLPELKTEMHDGFYTWLLGIYIEPNEPVGAELCFPVAFDGKYFTEFGPRIMLTSADHDRGPKRLGHDDDAVSVVDISVVRK